LFTLLSLLNVANSAALQCTICFFFFSLTRFFTFLTYVFRSFIPQDLARRMPSQGQASKTTPAAFLHQERQRRGSISFAKLEKQVLYAGGHKNHFLSLLSVSSLAAHPQALDEALAEKDQEVMLYCPPLTAGFFSFCYDGDQLGVAYK
jgi:hypothetical protein